MDFNQAIVAHSSWKRKLRSYLEKPDGNLKPEDAGAESKCELGKWIVAEGRAYASVPEFALLRAAHTRFHKAAGDLIRRADAGEKVDGEMALGIRSEISDATNAVISLITAIRRKV